MALADDLDAGQQEVVGRVLGNVDAEAGLKLVQLLLNLQDHVGEFVGGAVSVAVDAADVDVGEVVVGARLQGGDAHLGGRRLVVELNPQA